MLLIYISLLCANKRDEGSFDTEIVYRYLARITFHKRLHFKLIYIQNYFKNVNLIFWMNFVCG
jgi:hypothetical protein